MIATLAAIVFGAGGWLYGMAAVGLPVAAHLISRRIGRAEMLPTQRFVEEVAAEQHRRGAVRDYLLMVMRCVIVGLVVLAFAEVVWVGKEEPTLAKRGLPINAEKEEPAPAPLRIVVVSDEDADDPGNATFYLKRLDSESWNVEVVRSGGEAKGFDAAIVVGDEDVGVPTVRIAGGGMEGEAMTLEPMDPRKKPWEAFRGPAMATLRGVEFVSVGKAEFVGASDVLARWSDGEAAIWWNPRPRNGQELVFGADISPGVSGLVKSAAFVPLIRELVGVVRESDRKVEVSEPESAKQNEKRVKLWRWLIVGVVVLMGVETIATGKTRGRYAAMRLTTGAILAGILLGTMGNQTTGTWGTSAENGKNVWVRIDASAEVGYVGERLEIRVLVVKEGLGAREVRAKLMVDGEEVQSLDLQFANEETSKEIVWSEVIEAGEQRWIRYAAEVELEDGKSETEDNADEAMVRRAGKRIGVLMIEGELRWTTRWFADAIRRDPRNKLVQVLAYSDERKVVLNYEGEGAVRVEEFDVVALGRKIERVMEREEIESLVDFVVRRGGGLVMVGGEEVTDDAELREALREITPMEESRRIGAGRVIKPADQQMWRKAMTEGQMEEYRQWVGRIVRFAAYADERMASEQEELEPEAVKPTEDEGPMEIAAIQRENDEMWWRGWWMFGLLIGLLSMEWFMRRMDGLG